MNENMHYLKYIDIYNTLRDRIILKKYPENSVLPTESKLMEEFQVSRNTIRNALKKLQEDGYIVTRRGSGSIVQKNAFIEKANPASADWSSATVILEYSKPKETIKISPSVTDKVAAPADVTKAFGLEANTEVYRIHSIWTIDNLPYLYMVRYINPDILPDFSFYINEEDPLQNIIEDKKINVIETVQHISCCNADFIEANLLNVDVGTALLVTIRTGRCEQGIYEYAIMYGNAKYSSYQIIIN